MKQEKFNKMIDKFYAEKLKDYCINFLKQFNVDKKFVFTKNTIELYVKNRKWKEDYYIIVFVIPFEECFNFFMNDYKMDQLKDNIVNVIREKIESR